MIDMPAHGSFDLLAILIEGNPGPAGISPPDSRVNPRHDFTLLPDGQHDFFRKPPAASARVAGSLHASPPWVKE